MKSIDSYKTKIQIPGEDLSCPIVMPHPIGVVKAYLDAGFTVAYIDADDKRRKTMHVFYTVYPSQMLAVLAPVLTATAFPHYNVLVTVNEHDFDPIVRKELVAIAGVCNGAGSMIVRISL